MGKVGRRPQAAKLPCDKGNCSIIVPSSAPFGGTYPYPLCRFATSSLPLLAYGHFSLTGGIGPLIRGVGPQGEGLRAERTDAIMCVGAGHWPARKRAADSRPYGGKRTGGPAQGRKRNQERL